MGGVLEIALNEWGPMELPVAFMFSAEGGRGNGSSSIFDFSGFVSLHHCTTNHFTAVTILISGNNEQAAFLNVFCKFGIILSSVAYTFFMKEKKN